ncbi:MAG TPA: L,D-transpeptidase family protein [Allosphingosinicella sp.]
MTGARLSLLLLAALAACGRSPDSAPPHREARPLAGAALPPVEVGAEIAAFYAAHSNRPLWVTRGAVRPGAERAAALLAGAADHGLDPARYGAADLQAAVASARTGDAVALARFELLLSRGFTAYVEDLRAPAANPMLQVEEGLAPAPPSPRALLESLAAAPSLSEGVAGATRMNPLYGALQRGYARWRLRPHRPEEEAQARLNLDRVRAIPAEAPRYVVVDLASARLWMVDHGKVDGPMRVIVGKTNMKTPLMASRLRYAVLNPYWNMPPDLARDRAKRVLKQGPAFLAAGAFQILSDWGEAARPIPASAVNWRAAASGAESLRIRQLPGGANVMGRIKFMMPNRLGIYLHDFPDKSLFAREDRRLSSGCVRLSDAPRLARWLFRGAAPAPDGATPEQRADLPEAVPVYLTYVTALPGSGGLDLRADPYGLDRVQLASGARPQKHRSG